MRPLFSRCAPQQFVQDLEKYWNAPKQRLAEACCNDSVGNCKVQDVAPEGSTAVLMQSTKFYFQLASASGEAGAGAYGSAEKISFS